MARFRFFKFQEVNPINEPKIANAFTDDLMYDMFNSNCITYIRIDDDMIKAAYIPMDYYDCEYYEKNWLPYDYKLCKNKDDLKIEKLRAVNSKLEQRLKESNTLLFNYEELGYNPEEIKRLEDELKAALDELQQYRSLHLDKKEV